MSGDVRGSNRNSVIHTNLMRDNGVTVNQSINRLTYLLRKSQVQSAGSRLLLVQRSIVPCRNEGHLSLVYLSVVLFELSEILRCNY
jgi:hypothetical protein